MIAGLLALTIAAAFSGAAVYVWAVEHVARRALDIRAQLTQWKPSYKRGALMQASLSPLGTIAGAAAWWQTGDTFFLAGALFLIAPWPWTLLVIKPVNDRLLATPPDRAGSETQELLASWGHLHAVRMVLGLAATVLYLAALAG